MTADRLKTVQRISGDCICASSTLQKGNSNHELACPDSISKYRASFGVDATFRVLFLFFLFLLLSSKNGQAQGVFNLAHGEWEASVFGGVSFLGAGIHQTPAEGSGQPSSRAVGLSYSTGAQMGIRVTDNHWRHWGSTLEYSYSNQPITFTNLSDSVPSLGLGHAIHRFAFDVLYYPLDRNYKLRPFVFAGPGVSLFYVKGSGKEAAGAMGVRLSDPWKFTMNWGGGVKYLVRKQIAASFQFSDSISGVPSYGMPETGRVISGKYVPGFRPEGLQHNWLIGIGFVYQWEGS
jgi:opacity protein-like surface antigen